MLPLSVMEECLTGLRLTDILCLLPTATSYMTRCRFRNNNYYLIIKHLILYTTYILPSTPTHKYFIHNNIII